jgi:hypothetical protein
MMVSTTSTPSAAASSTGTADPAAARMSVTELWSHSPRYGRH